MALTDEQIIACWERTCYGLGKYEKFARAIESAACAERDARIAELERQLAEARKQMEAQKDEWLSWAAKRKALEKDAERYQWAVSVCESDGFGYWLPEVCLKEGPLPPSKEEADAAIDNAMQK